MPNRIILASSSPRRKELLTLASIQFEIQVPDVDETPLKKESPVEMVKRLSLSKAMEIWRNSLSAGDSGYILAADTTVVNSKDKILGKPADEREAVKMLMSLQGKVHQVHTGYALLKVVKGELQKQVVKSVRTKVTIQKMDSKDAKRYVAKGESYDKAGGYAAQGYGMVIVEKLEGSYTNVVGLPVVEVIRDLKKMGWKL